MFEKESIIAEIQKVQKAIENGSIDTFAIDVAPLPKTPQKTVWKECDEHNIFVPDPREDDSEALISIDTSKSVAKLHTNTPPCDNDPSHEKIVSAIDALRSAEVTPEEQALGRHTRQKLKTLENWPQWSAGKRKQLDQFHDLEMHGDPCPLPPNGVLLRSHLLICSHCTLQQLTARVHQHSNLSVDHAGCSQPSQFQLETLLCMPLGFQLHITTPDNGQAQSAHNCLKHSSPHQLSLDLFSSTVSSDVDREVNTQQPHQPQQQQPQQQPHQPREAMGPTKVPTRHHCTSADANQSSNPEATMAPTTGSTFNSKHHPLTTVTHHGANIVHPQGLL